jgi:hypothetical protein
MTGNVSAATSEGKRAGVAQDGLGLVGVAAARRRGTSIAVRRPPVPRPARGWAGTSGAPAPSD